MDQAFLTAYELWADSVETHVSPSTYRRYTNLAACHILPVFGERLVGQITTEDIKDLISAKQKEGLSDATLRMIILVLKNILRFCGSPVEAGLKVKTDLHVDIPKEETQRLRPEDEKILEQSIFSDTDETSLVILLALKMGMQLGEICGLRFQDIDLSARRIHVRHVVQRFPGRNGQKKTELVLIEPSGEAQKRSIPIPDSVMKKLQTLESGTDSLEQFVANGKTDRLPDPRTIQYRFRKVLKKLNLPEYKFIALRHTFAFNCIDRGMDMELLSKLMGNVNVSATAARYAVGKKEAEEVQIRKFLVG